MPTLPASVLPPAEAEVLEWRGRKLRRVPARPLDAVRHMEPAHAARALEGLRSMSKSNTAYRPTYELFLAVFGREALEAAGVEAPGEG